MTKKLIFSKSKKKKNMKTQQGPVLNQINAMAEKNAGGSSSGKGGKRR